MENISVSEAATLAGVGKSTIRRAIKKGELLATTVEGPNGEQFSVSVSSFEKWMYSKTGEWPTREKARDARLAWLDQWIAAIEKEMKEQ